MVIPMAIVVIFAYFGHLPMSTCWDRTHKASFFDGAVFVRRNSALKTNILRKLQTLGAIQCSQACLSKDNCVAQTYCEAWRSEDKGTCFLHKNGIAEEQISVLARMDKCTYQQYINFYETSCTSQCNNRGKCFYDYHDRRYSCRCEPPYHGTFCEKSQAIYFLFKSLGIHGNSGPTSTLGYTNTSLQGSVTLDKGIQIWTVPFTALYTLTMAGASGGNADSSKGGLGAVVSGVVQLVKGTQLHILIGQKGVKGTSGAGTSGAGGGGGTFVADIKNTLLAAAGGGGGGGGQITSLDGDNGQTSENGSEFGGTSGLGGTVRGTQANDAGGGGGFYGDGTCCMFNSNTKACVSQTCKQAGLSYLNGGLGGTGTGDGFGGFGGGGAADNYFAGGGGGYSGGGAHATTSFGARGGGGGSYYTSGVKPTNDNNDGDGYVLIVFLK